MNLPFARRNKRHPLPTPSQATSRIDLPANTFIETERGLYYLTGKKKRYRIITRRVLDSWSPPRVVTTTEASVAHYPVWSRLKFRNGSLIHNYADGKIYLIVDGKRHHVTSPDVLSTIGASRQDVVDVSLTEISLHEEGEPLA